MGRTKIKEYPIVREQGYLYFVGSDGYVYKTEMARGGRKAKKKK